MAGFVNADIIINEILYAPDTTLQGTDANFEWVELFNNGTTTINLETWELEENAFGDVNISPGEYVVVARKLLGDSSFEAYYGNNDSVWNASDSLINYTAVDGGFGAGLSNTGEIINLSNGSTTQFTVDYTQFATLNLGKGNGRTLIFYKGTFTESAIVNGTPGATNDQFAPDFNKWANPSKNNSIVGGLVNVTVNITDVTNVSSVLVDFNGTNSTMQQGNAIWHFVLNTTRFVDGLYNLTAYFNDTNGFSNSDTLLDVTVDNTKPNITAPVTSANSRNYANPGFNFNASVNATDANLLNVTCTLGSTTVANFSNDGNIYYCNLTSALEAATISNSEQDFEITFTSIDKVGNTNITTTTFTTKHNTTASLSPNDVTLTNLNDSAKVVNINATFNNTGPSTIYEPGIRLTGLSTSFPGSILTDYVACNELNLTPGQSCTANLNVTVDGGSTGTFNAFWKANWTDANFSQQSLSQSVSSSISINPNPIIKVPQNISTTVQHGTEQNITLHINSTGNVDLADVNITFVPINLTTSQVSFVPDSFTTITSSNETVNVTVTIAKATSPGNYTSLFNITANNTEFKTVSLFVEVLQDTTWTTSPNLTKTFKRTSASGTAATISINNSGNVDQDFTISYEGTLFSELMLSPVTVVTSLSVSKNSVGNFNIDHNADGPLTSYDLSVTITNQLTSEINKSVVILTRDDNNPFVNITNPINGSFVKGDVEFNVTATDLNLSRLEYFINNSLVFNSVDINFTFNWDTTNGSYSDEVYELKVIAFDSTGNFNISIIQNITVNNTDSNPILRSNIPQIDITEDNDSTTLNLSLFFESIDGDSLKYNFTQPNNIIVHVNNVTEIANFTPDLNFNGTNFIVFTAIDTSLNTTSSNNVTINVANVNDAPTTPNLVSPSSGSNVTSSLGKAALVWSASTDADNDAITYYVFVSNDSSDIRFNATSTSTTLSLTNLDNNVTYFWNVLASDDSLNSSNSSIFNFTMIRDNNPEFNWTWDNTIDSSSTNTTPFVAENKTLSFKINASDPDNDPINSTWFIDSVEKSNVQNFTFNLTNNFTAAGSYTIKLKVQDNNSNSVEQEWTVTVTNTNREPILDSIVAPPATEDSVLEFNITVNDPDNDTLTFTSNFTSSINPITFTKDSNNSLA